MASEQTQDMELPLHAAAKEGYPALVKLLLEFDYKTAVEESVKTIFFIKFVMGWFHCKTPK